MQETCKGANSCEQNLLIHFRSVRWAILFSCSYVAFLNPKPTYTNGKLLTDFRASDWGNRDDFSKQEASLASFPLSGIYVHRVKVSWYSGPRAQPSWHGASCLTHIQTLEVKCLTLSTFGCDYVIYCREYWETSIFFSFTVIFKIRHRFEMCELSCYTQIHVFKTTDISYHISYLPFCKDNLHSLFLFIIKFHSSQWLITKYN